MKKKKSAYGQWWEEEDLPFAEQTITNSLLPPVSLKSYDLYCNEVVSEVESDGKPKGFLPFIDQYDDGGKPKGLFGLISSSAENLYHTKIVEKGDGKPKGFLPFIDQKQLPFADGKPKGILPFLERDDYNLLQSLKKKEEKETKKDTKRKRFNTIGTMNQSLLPDKLKQTISSEAFSSQRSSSKLFSKKHASHFSEFNAFDFVPVDVSNVKLEEYDEVVFGKKDSLDNIEVEFDLEEYGEEDEEVYTEEEEDEKEEKNVNNPSSNPNGQNNFVRHKSINLTGYTQSYPVTPSIKKPKQQIEQPVSRTSNPIRTYPWGLSKSSEYEFNRHSSDYPPSGSMVAQGSGYSDFFSNSIVTLNTQNLNSIVINNYLDPNINNTNPSSGYSQYIVNNNNASIKNINNINNPPSSPVSNGYSQKIINSPPLNKSKQEKAINNNNNNNNNSAHFQNLSVSAPQTSKNKSPILSRKSDSSGYSQSLNSNNIPPLIKKQPKNEYSPNIIFHDGNISKSGYATNITNPPQGLKSPSYNDSGYATNIVNLPPSKPKLGKSNSSVFSKVGDVQNLNPTGYSQNLPNQTSNNNNINSNINNNNNNNNNNVLDVIVSINSHSSSNISHPLSVSFGDIQYLTMGGQNLNSSGYSQNLNSSDYSPTLSSSGFSQNLNSSGYSQNLNSSGYSQNLSGSGYSQNLGGHSPTLTSSGYSQNLVSSQSRLKNQNIKPNNNIINNVDFDFQNFELDSKVPVIVNKRDWNEEFQSLMTRVFENDHQAIISLKKLCDEFAEIAKRVGTVIVEELFISKESRTIPAVTDSIGGMAGGEKYVYAPEGIFFKFAVC